MLSKIYLLTEKSDHHKEYKDKEANIVILYI